MPGVHGVREPSAWNVRIGSLCSGIGGLELGLERAGIGHTVWQCEYDPHASQVLANHWDVPNHGDVKVTDWTQVEPVDVLCAGYPCQPFSTAGRRGGADDPRHLWPAVRDAVGSLGPRLVILENVRGHLSLGFDAVLGDLADLGFDAGWCLLRASDVGAPHQRARLFVAAYSADAYIADDGRPDASRRKSDVGRGDPRSAGEGQEAARGSGPATPDAQVERGERDGRAWDGWPGPTHGGVAVADATGERRGQRERPRTDVVHDGLQPAFVGEGDVRWGPYAPAIRRWEAVHGPAPAPTVDGRLSPDFVCWMMGFPAGWVDGLSRTAALRCLGNAVVPQVAERFGRMVLGDVGGGVVQPDTTLLPTPTSSHPGGSLEDYHARLRDARPDAEPSFTPLNMLVEQVLGG